MEKMFKRTLIGAAVASLTMAGAVQAKPATDTVDLYGQVALSVWQYGEDKIGGGDAPLKLENESRFGLRGSHELARGPKFIWQLEGGNVGDDGAASGLGVRDTYGGFEFEEAGRVRIGRMLTPLYEIIDWPYSGQRAGAIFDWGGDVVGGARYDRQSNMVRYDSANLGGFTFNLAAGRGDESQSDSNFYGLGAHYTVGVLTLHGGYEYGKDRNIDALNTAYNNWIKQNPGQPVIGDKDEVSGRSDTQAALLGFELNFDTFAFNGAFKYEEAKYNEIKHTPVDSNDPVLDLSEFVGSKLSQNSYSLGAVYSGVENWQFKMNYAANLDPEIDGTKVSDLADYIVSAQALYFLDDSAITYVRPYMISKDNSSAEFGWGLGVEYYF
ncbi:porin [Vibrio mediterranei]|jgi:predicted porin|uniref:Porin n=1 Tax=Vibrio mediterranei TaxID=689 RepID=A0ABX5DEQ4_9VIBR|nr:porin [Vibrio mediterranei]MCG9661079.1 porin [Vibrio mediterranei]MCG9664457.1 porin [Vibrio mediterranei]PCD90378.1 porin [Vibrio mediterranei]PRQ67653.1 porin [Vibrio mediterranei]PTC05573.1 porin [Vibrio mediterranei]